MKWSFDEIRSKVYEIIKAKATRPDVYDSWIVELYEDEVVYQVAGALYRAPYSMSKEGEVSLGEAVKVQKEIKYKPIFSEEVLFSAFTESKSGTGAIIKKGKIFEAGDYPDKGVAFDEDDLDRIVESFEPVENDIEHRSSILDSKLGKLISVERKGKELFGEIEVPDWLDNLVGDNPLKVSLAFDRDKKIVGNALVLRPRIEDAAVMSAYSLFNANPEPGSKGPGTKKMKMTLASLLAAFGIKAQNPTEEIEVPSALESHFSEPPKESTPAPVTPGQPQFAQTVSPEIERQLAEIKASNRSLTDGVIRQAATVFAEGLVAKGKLIPAQAASVAALYENCVRMDAGEGSVFTADSTLKTDGPNVAALIKLYEDAPLVKALGEQVTGFKLGNNTGETEFSDQSEIEKMLGMTELGRAALKARKGS